MQSFIIALFLAFVFALAATSMHLYWLGGAKRRFDCRATAARGRLLLFAEIFSSHLLAAVIFAGALWIGVQLGLGAFKDASLPDPMS